MLTLFFTRMLRTGSLRPFRLEVTHYTWKLFIQLDQSKPAPVICYRLEIESVSVWCGLLFQTGNLCRPAVFLLLGHSHIY